MDTFDLHEWNKKRYLSRLNESIDFKVKGVDFTYTDYGSLYGIYLYDVPATANVAHKKKIWKDEAEEWMKTIGIDVEIPRSYDTSVLKDIVSKLEAKGLVADYNDAMDVS
jgi:hypothetical protein